MLDELPRRGLWRKRRRRERKQRSRRMKRNLRGGNRRGWIMTGAEEWCWDRCQRHLRMVWGTRYKLMRGQRNCWLLGGESLRLVIGKGVMRRGSKRSRVVREIILRRRGRQGSMGRWGMMGDGMREGIWRESTWWVLGYQHSLGRNCIQRCSGTKKYFYWNEYHHIQVGKPRFFIPMRRDWLIRFEMGAEKDPRNEL